MKKLLVLILALGTFVFLSGCGAKAPIEKAPAQKAVAQDQTLKIGVLPIEDNLPLFLAEAEKRFAAAGLNVELVPFPSAAERDAALQAGRIDGEAADIVAACLLKKGGTDIRIASVTLGVTPQEGRFALLSSPASGIKSAQDLAGVEVAISQNTIIEYVNDMLLKKEGLKSDQIKKISIPKIPIRVEMLVNNQVKAALVPDPFAALAEKQGARVILDDTKGEANISQVVLMFRKEVIDQKREAVVKLLQVYGQAGQDLTANPAKYRSLLIEKARIPKPIEKTYQSPTYSLPQVPREQEVANVVSWMMEKKLLTAPYSYAELVDQSLIK